MPIYLIYCFKQLNAAVILYFDICILTDIFIILLAFALKTLSFLIFMCYNPYTL